MFVHNIQEHFKRRAQGYDRERSRNWHHDSPFRVRVEKAVAASIMDAPSRGIVLDVGCGTGRGTLDSAGNGRLGSRILIGVDLSRDMLELFQRKAAKLGIRSVCVRADATALPLAADSVDLVIALSLVQYLPIDAFATEMSRVCRPGSYLLLGAACLSDADTSGWRNFSNQRFGYPSVLRHGASLDTAIFDSGFEVATEPEIVLYRRLFEDLRRDKAAVATSQDLDRDIEIFRSAPADMRAAYRIDGEGFVQLYRLCRYRLGYPRST
jgi:ubiquinone/menaquinone biosynthesis C-methylase UbiE